jgi:serine/threonine protein kinase
VRRSKELLPGYVGLKRLSHGRRLDTWDALDLDRGTRCVVKVLRADRLDDAEVREAVLREGEILTNVAHPHLVRCFDVITEPRPAVVLETLRGSTVAALVDEAPLEVADVAMLGVQLGSVLGYLHGRGWLHLDVKPENVVAEHGKAVLLDLSLAGRPGDGRPGAGTPGYLAPEQARGTGLSAATDVWGLTVTLWECLTGELPFGDHEVWEDGPADRVPTGLPAHVPAQLTAVLHAGLDSDPSARPDLDALSSVLVGLT